MVFSGKTIFFAPLDWGYGHATRSVPVIRTLLKNNNRVVLGVTPAIQALFYQEFPKLEQVLLPSYNIRYSTVLPLWAKLLIQWPALKTLIKQEQQLLEKILQQKKIDVVVSDSRFGLHSKNAHSVFITHQLFLKAPFATRVLQRQNKGYVLAFDEVWVPDYESEQQSLAGLLSHGKHYHPNVRYIGPQSRLSAIPEQEKKYDYLFLLSGPEPQHSLLGKKLLQEAVRFPQLKFALCSPVFMPQPLHNLEAFVNPTPTLLAQLVAQSKTVVCRSGYSTLMDMHILGKKDLILIPTPGQTEQEYLAERWAKHFQAACCKQQNFQITP